MSNSALDKAKLCVSIDTLVDAKKALKLSSLLTEFNIALTCPDCGQPVRPRRESSVYSKMYTAAHFAHIKKNPDCPRYKKAK